MSTGHSKPIAGHVSGSVAGYAAFVWGVVFAAISFYWGVGGTLGLDTVWGASAASAEHSSVLRAAVWLTGVLKLVAALLALALVTEWGRVFPRRPMAVLGWSAAVVLTLYGGVNVVAEALTALGIIRPGAVDWKPLLWHLYVWDMSFLVWGILFGIAVRQYGLRR